MKRHAVICAALVLFSGRASAIVVPGADGSDGTFNPASSTVVNLANAVTGTWDQPGAGAGVYDPDKWAVVFKYSSVNIESIPKLVENVRGSLVSYAAFACDLPPTLILSSRCNAVRSSGSCL